MLALYTDSKILLATKPADFRKGIDGFRLVSLPAQARPSF